MSTAANAYVTKKGYVYAIVDGKKKRVSAVTQRHEKKEHQDGGMMNKSLGVGDLSYICRYVWMAMLQYGTVEICGHLTYRPDISYDTFECFMTKLGDSHMKDGQLRNFCSNTPASFIWHTHPVGGKLFPSKEDLLQMLDKERIDEENQVRERYFRTHRDSFFSLLFTPYGYWKFENVRKMNYGIDVFLTIEEEKRILDDIKRVSRDFYEHEGTKKGRFYDANAMYTLVRELNDIFKGKLVVHFVFVEPIFTVMQMKRMRNSSTSSNTYNSMSDRSTRARYSTTNSAPEYFQTYQR